MDNHSQTQLEEQVRALDLTAQVIAEQLEQLQTRLATLRQELHDGQRYLFSEAAAA